MDIFYGFITTNTLSVLSQSHLDCGFCTHYYVVVPKTIDILKAIHMLYLLDGADCSTNIHLQHDGINANNMQMMLVTHENI